jgi:DNA-binding NarL/FixJ family response regulator
VKVLVIDDSVPVRKRVAAVLAEIPGVDAVLECGGSVDALELLREQSPEIIVLDLNLRGESGLAFMRRAKLGSVRPLLIVLTNESSERHRRECVARGADHFFDKSRDVDHLLGVVAKAAARSGR